MNRRQFIGLAIALLMLAVAPGIGIAEAQAATPKTTPHVVTSGTHYDVYLFAGQSNMDGRGKIAELDETHRRPLANAIIFYRNPPFSGNGWKPLTPGYSAGPGFKGALPSATFGPEIGFAHALLKAKPALHLALIKAPKGGTSIEQWTPGARNQPDTQGPCYRNFISATDLALKELGAQGATFTIRGLLWHQGESNAKDSADAYAKKLTTLIERIREDLRLPQLPVVAGEVYDNGKRDTVRAATRQVATQMPHLGFASAEGLKTWDNGTHFDAASQLILGERYAGAMSRLVPEK